VTPPEAPSALPPRGATRAARRSPFFRGCLVAALALAAVCTTLPAAAQRADVATLDYRLQARAVAEGVYVVEGANADFAPANGCNIINTGFIVTGAGVVVVNSGVSKRYGEQLRALIQRTTAQPVVELIHLNLHPDYFLGNQAFADVPLAATAATLAGMQREAAAYETNLYRLCGDWMRDTQAVLPQPTLKPGVRRVGGREFELRELSGHTDSDLVLIDRASGVAFVGGLVFVDRVPTTPHARVAPWLASLAALEQLPGVRLMVPSHGPLAADGRGLAQTRRYLQWLDAELCASARRGLEITEILARPVPAEFRAWAAFDTEYLRNLTHLYPRYEDAVLRPAR
jgi:quinoprotein relay system zinc metallohydrolase 1